MMPARGIVHSERTPSEWRAVRNAPLRHPDLGRPAEGSRGDLTGFAHHGADALPVIEGEGTRLRLIAGSLYGMRAPVHVFSNMFYVDAALFDAARFGNFPAWNMKSGHSTLPTGASNLTAVYSMPGNCSSSVPAQP